MPPFRYVFVLRRGEDVIATGRTMREDPVEVGDRVTLGGREGIVRSVEPILGEPDLRLVVQLIRDDD